MEKENMTKTKSSASKIAYIILIVVLVLMILALVFNNVVGKTAKYENPIATIEVEGYGNIVVELFPEYAPITVSNFIKLAENGYYDGLKFHRVVKDFMIQGGDKNGDGTGDVTLGDLYGTDDDTSYSIKGEFKSNGVNNPIVMDEGVIAMARADYTQESSDLVEESYNSAGSQFFIMTQKTPNLNGQYAAFGKVIDGKQVVHDIENVEVKQQEEDEEVVNSNSEKSVPVQDVIIKSITIDTKGKDYTYPETQEPFNYMKWYYKSMGIDDSQWEY